MYMQFREGKELMKERQGNGSVRLIEVCERMMGEKIMIVEIFQGLGCPNLAFAEENTAFLLYCYNFIVNPVARVRSASLCVCG